ncbi:MAG: choice-of-anchor L domain-containing protein [Candidatus Krumholzibacteriota bacterium]|nr:choice-of-anchor L domain-containing protein [Candidatus Krumholzibacteriota bacterium]
MRSPFARRHLAWPIVLLVLLSLGCGYDPVELPPNEAAQIVPHVTFITDLAVDQPSLMAGEAADLAATLKFSLPADLALRGARLYAIDANGDSTAALADMTDDGSAAHGDLLAGDDVFSAAMTGLDYATPQTLRLRVLVETLQTGQGIIRHDWSSVAILEVQREEIRFVEELEISPAGVLVGQQTDVRALTSLSVQDSLTLESVSVYRIGEMGDTLQLKARLWDNGDLDILDEIEGDGMFTGIIQNVSFFMPVRYRLRAMATAVSAASGLRYRAWSTVADLHITYPTGENALEDILAYQDSVEARYHACRDGGLADGAAKAACVEWLEAQPRVSQAYVSPDSATVWAVFIDEIEAGVLLPDDRGEGPVFGAAARVDHGRSPVPHERGVFHENWRDAGERGMDDPDEAHSNQAVVMSPFHTWLADLPGGDPCDELAADFEAAHCPSFGVDYLTDADVTVAAFTELYRYGAIVVVTHGTMMAGGEICLLTGEPANLATVHDFNWDFKSGQPMLTLVRVDGVSYFAVKAGFISRYNHCFANSVVYLCACSSLANNSLPYAFLDRGAGYVAGFDDAVGVEWANGVTLSFWEEVLAPSSAGGAFDAVSPRTEPGHAGASLVELGNRAVAFGVGLQNGTFELGSLAAWITEGDGRVIHQLDDQTPYEGITMGIVSTGLGFTTSTGEIRQTVCVPAGVTTLRFAYNYFSEEFLEWCGSQFQDYFQVSLTPRGGVEIVLFEVQIDDLCDSVEPASIKFDQGPHGSDPVGVYRTGWIEVEIDVTAYAGQTVELRFAAGDIGDSIYDSAILIDAIRVE